MLCRDVIDIIESAYPGECALEWDNTGLLAGRDDKEVKKVYLALDATDEVIDEAVRAGADMLVTHHPLIFGGIKRVTNLDFIGRRLLKLIRHDISYYAMHTNYDIKGMAERSCEKLHFEQTEVLDVTGTGADGSEEGIGRIADISPRSLKELCRQVKEAFDIEKVEVFGCLEKEIRRAAICPGSGKSVTGTAAAKGADVLITGDIGHHEGIDAAAQGMAVINAGHYGIEHIFSEDMKRYFEKNIPGIKAETASMRRPSTFI